MPSLNERVQDSSVPDVPSCLSGGKLSNLYRDRELPSISDLNTLYPEQIILKSDNGAENPGTPKFHNTDLVTDNLNEDKGQKRLKESNRVEEAKEIHNHEQLRSLRVWYDWDSVLPRGNLQGIRSDTAALDLGFDRRNFSTRLESFEASGADPWPVSKSFDLSSQNSSYRSRRSLPEKPGEFTRHGALCCFGYTGTRQLTWPYLFCPSRIIWLRKFGLEKRPTQMFIMVSWSCANLRDDFRRILNE